MIPKIPVNQHITSLKLLINGKKGEENSKLLSEKFSSELALFQDLIDHLDNDETQEIKRILTELGIFTQIKEFSKGHFFRNLFGINNDFIMLLKGKVLEFDIKYVNTTMSFKEYILYLTYFYLLNEKYIYWDCLKKNCEAFPFNTFKYLIENWTKGFNLSENEKSRDKRWVTNIDIIEICKQIKIKDFNFMKELEKLKEQIKKSNWNKIKIPQGDNVKEEDLEKIINSFLNLYNFKLEENIKKKSSTKDEKYKVLLPYFYKKRIISPISFIGDLNRPIKMKNYSSFLCLNDCFIVYIDKLKLTPTSSLYKYIYKNKTKYIAETLFKEHYLFENIEIDYLYNFGKYMELINLNKDEILFKQGEPHKGVYIIMNGKIQIETYQSYKDLIYIKFLLMHSLEFCPQFISQNKKEGYGINFDKTKKNNYLDGYYDYNSYINILMKNSVFKEKSKEKEELIFFTYKKNDVLGLGEIFDYKNRINIFTARALTNDAELIFIPWEIFLALLSIETICNKIGNLTEEKAMTLGKCIDKYKKIFEKKIELLLNSKKNYKKLQIFNPSQNFFNILQKINSNPIGIRKGKFITGYNNNFINKENVNENQRYENDKNDNLNDTENNETNNINNINLNEENILHQKNEEFLSEKKKLLRNNTNNYLNEKMYSNTYMESTNFDNKNNNKLLLSDSKKKLIFNSLFPSINKRNLNNEKLSNFNSAKKRKRSAKPLIISYNANLNSEKDNLNKKYNTRNKKNNIRSFSAQRFDEQDIKKSIYDYQNNFKERNKFYNSLSGKNSGLILNKNKDNPSNKRYFNNQKLNNLNNKKIVINKFSSSSLFKKNYKLNKNVSKSNMN